MDRFLGHCSVQVSAAHAPSEARLRDADLIAHLAAANWPVAFSMLAERYSTKVYRLCVTLLRDEAAAQDAAQDALLRAWRALAAYDPARAAPSTWLYAIARNRCLSLLAAAAPPTDSMGEPQVEQAALAVAQALPAQGPDAAQTLRAWVRALPQAQRQCLQLYYYEEHSVAEAAALLGLPEATVKTHLHRGRAALLQRMRANGLADARLWL